jgi:hypothetical protein
MREAAAARGIGLDAPLYCCETVAESTKRGFFASILGAGADPTHYIGVVLTPAWLVWAQSGPKSRVFVQVAALKELTVSEYDWREGDETGVQLSGIVNDAPKRVTVFLGLGSDPAAGKFKLALRSALEKAKA